MQQIKQNMQQQIREELQSKINVKKAIRDGVTKSSQEKEQTNKNQFIQDQRPTTAAARADLMKDRLKRMLAKWNADVEKNHASSDDPTNIWEKNSADSMRSNVTKVTTMTKGTTQSGALINNLNNNLANKAVNES